MYIFFAGHGLASDNGDKTYLISYDEVPDFLERTAIFRDEIAKPLEEAKHGLFSYYLMKGMEGVLIPTVTTRSWPVNYIPA